ncbi:MAG: hypothetical protein RIS70_1244 [Planctomycetota bacterium]
MSGSWLTRNQWSRSPFVPAVGAAAILLAIAASCYGLLGTRSVAKPFDESHLRVGILPERTAAESVRKSRRLLSYLEKDFGIPCHKVDVDSPEDLLDQFVAGEIDLALLNAYTFVQARQRCNAVPLVTRTNDPWSTAVLVAPAKTFAEASNRSLESFRGQSIATGPSHSTCGDLIPRHLLTRIGESPDSFFSEIHFCSHPNEIFEKLADGSTQLAAMNSNCLDKQSNADAAMLDSLSIVWESTPFVDHVWTVTNRMPVRIQHRIRDAFLALRESDPEHAAILADQDSGGYLPVIVSDFDGVAELVRELNESGNHRSESP